MKYRFSLKPEVRATVEWELESYREDKRQLIIAMRDMIPSGVQGLSPTAGIDGGEAKRSTEEVTLKIISAPYIRRLEIKVDAIDRALTRVDDTDMKLIDLIYWRKLYTPEGAGMAIGMSRATVYRRLNKIFCAVAFEMGYIKDLL